MASDLMTTATFLQGGGAGTFRSFPPGCLAQRRERVHLPVPVQVEPPPVRDDGRVPAVGKAPELPAGARVEAVRAAGERGEVDDAVDDRGRARDRAVRVEAPELPAGRRVEGVEEMVVR